MPPDTGTPAPSPHPVETPTTLVANLSNLFNAELVSVYVGPTNVTGIPDPFGWNLTLHPTNYYPAEILLNLTYLAPPKNVPFDAVFEGFLVTLTADTGTTASLVGYLGTNLNPSFSNLPFFPPSPSGPQRSIYFSFNLTANESVRSLRIFDGGSFGSGSGSLGLWTNGPPNTITVTIQRADWYVVYGGSLSIVMNPAKDAVLQQVQLEKSGNGVIFQAP
jgi:hypothetical protein